MSERVYDPADLAIAYRSHLIVEVETLGGIRTIDTITGEQKHLALGHDERLFAARGMVVDYGEEALRDLVLAHTSGSLGYNGTALFPCEVVYEPKSDTLIVPPDLSATGRPLVLVAVGDVLAIVNRQEAPAP